MVHRRWPACSRLRQAALSGKRPGGGWRRIADEGSVTAEFAVVLPAVVMVALLLIGLTRTVAVTMQCQDAAAVAVRELVVSGERSDPQSAAQAVAGDGVSVSVQHNGDRVSVTVTCPVLPGPLDVLPTRVTAEAAGIMQ